MNKDQHPFALNHFFYFFEFIFLSHKASQDLSTR
jgi:hypothetical protein